MTLFTYCMWIVTYESDSCATTFVVRQARLFQAILLWNCRQTARSWFREIECVCVGERETAWWRVCVGARVCMCVCVCVLAWAIEREKVCVCVCVCLIWCCVLFVVLFGCGYECGVWRHVGVGVGRCLTLFLRTLVHIWRVYCMCVCMCGYLFCEC